MLGLGISSVAGTGMDPSEPWYTLLKSTEVLKAVLVYSAQPRATAKKKKNPHTGKELFTAEINSGTILSPLRSCSLFSVDFPKRHQDTNHGLPLQFLKLKHLNLETLWPRVQGGHVGKGLGVSEDTGPLSTRKG